MAAVKADADWPLKFGGKIYRTVKAQGAVGPHHALDL